MKDVKNKVVLNLIHYKWYILIALFFIVFISVMSVQMCTRDGHDISVMYAGPAVIADSQNAAIESAFGKLGKDTDGDGKTEVLFYDLVIMSDEELNEAYNKGYSTSTVNKDTVQNALDAFQLNILSDDHFILFLSPERYEIMLGNGALEKLADIGVSSEKQYNEYAIRLRDIEFAQFYTAFSVLPDDTLVCFKRISEVNAEKKKVLERREESIELIKAFVDYRVPAGTIIQGAETGIRKEESGE